MAKNSHRPDKENSPNVVVATSPNGDAIDAVIAVAAVDAAAACHLAKERITFAETIASIQRYNAQQHTVSTTVSNNEGSISKSPISSASAKATPAQSSAPRALTEQSVDAPTSPRGSSLGRMEPDEYASIGLSGGAPWPEEAIIEATGVNFAVEGALSWRIANYSKCCESWTLYRI